MENWLESRFESIAWRERKIFLVNNPRSSIKRNINIKLENRSKTIDPRSTIKRNINIIGKLVGKFGREKFLLRTECRNNYSIERIDLRSSIKRNINISLENRSKTIDPRSTLKRNINIWDINLVRKFESVEWRRRGEKSPSK